MLYIHNFSNLYLSFDFHYSFLVGYYEYYYNPFYLAEEGFYYYNLYYSFVPIYRESLFFPNMYEFVVRVVWVDLFTFYCFIDHFFMRFD